jgi:hypothetical protein
MSRLTHVDLSRLRVATEVDEAPWHPLDRFSDTAMALKATWTTKEEVQAGLLHASVTGRVTSSEFRAPTSPTELSTIRYLNLRWANFKANPSRYGWTAFESYVLRWHRAGLASGSETRIDNGDIYPVPEAPALRSTTVETTEKGARGAKRTASSPYSDTTAESQLRATKLVRQPKRLCVSGSLKNSEQTALYSYISKVSSETTFVCSADGVCWRTYNMLGSLWSWYQPSPYKTTFRCDLNGYCKPTATWYGRLGLQVHTTQLHLLTYPEKENCEPQTSNEDMGVPPSALVSGRPGEKAEPETQMGSKALDVLAPAFVPGNPTHTTRREWSELQGSIKRVKKEIRADIKRLEEEIEELMKE